MADPAEALKESVKKLKAMQETVKKAAEEAKKRKEAGGG